MKTQKSEGVALPEEQNKMDSRNTGRTSKQDEQDLDAENKVDC